MTKIEINKISPIRYKSSVGKRKRNKTENTLHCLHNISIQLGSLASFFSSSLKKKEEEIEARNKNKEGSNNLEKQKR